MLDTGGTLFLKNLVLHCTVHAAAFFTWTRVPRKHAHPADSRKKKHWGSLAQFLHASAQK
jgi:hypothetical protein